MMLGVDPKVDYAFKRLFGDERNADILIHLLNAILKPVVPIVSIEILNPFNEKDFAEDKLTVLDIKVRDQAGRQTGTEMQLLFPRHFRGRILYYWASFYGQQLAEGDEYEKLRPTISICFVNQKLFPKVAEYHLEFGLYDQKHKLCFSNHIQIHLLELPKFDLRVEQLRTPEEKWLYFLRHAATLDPDSLPAPLDEPVFRKAAKELTMLTRDALERERYEAREKAYRDQISLLQEAKEEGRGEGELIGQIHLCQRFLKRPLTPREELVRLSVEELRQRAEELEAEMFRS